MAMPIARSDSEIPLAPVEPRPERFGYFDAESFVAGLPTAAGPRPAPVSAAAPGEAQPAPAPVESAGGGASAADASSSSACCVVEVDPEIHVPSPRFRVMLDFELAPAQLLHEPEPQVQARDLPGCPVCKQRFLRTHLTRSCPGCGRAHHLGCWDAWSGCALCDPPPRRRPSAEAIQSVPPPPRYSSREWTTIGVLLATIATSLAWTLLHV